MRREVLEGMSDADLAEYAAALDVDLSGCADKGARVDAVLGRRDRSVELTAYGWHCRVQLKRLHDMYTAEKLQEFQDSDRVSDLVEINRLVLGEEQEQSLRSYVTDEDGVEDADAYTAISVKVYQQVQEKN